MDWELTKNVVTTIQSFLASIAIVAGGIWTYYRFIRFRTLKPQLEFAFEFNQFVDDREGHIAILELKLRNKGNTLIELRKNKTNMCFLRYGLIDTSGAAIGVAVISKRSKQLKSIDDVFTAHKWIEPNETIDDVKILHIHAGNNVAIQIEVEILGSQKWSSSTAFPLTRNTAAATFTSEDEQDDLTETERVIDVIRAKLDISRTALGSPGLAENKKSGLEALIEQAEELLVQLEKIDSADKRLLRQSWDLVQMFDKFLE